MCRVEHLRERRRTMRDVLDDCDIPGPGAWTEQALCIGLPDLFTAAPKPEPAELAVAEKMCRRCPVRVDCAAYADENATYGMWAGRWYGTRSRKAAAA